MSEKKKNFINMMAPHVREIAARTGLDPRLILAQSAVETGWGGKAPGHNYFGIKSHNREGGQNFMTTEYIRGVPVKKVQNFREYSGPQESSQDYANFILENPRYQAAMKAKTIDDQIKAIGKSGYATDPRYGQKLRDVALGIELPPELLPEDKPVVEEQRPVEQKQQSQPTEQPQPLEQEAEAVSYNQIDPQDEPIAFADGGKADDYIPHDDPRRQDNFSNWFGYSHIVDQSGNPVTLYHGTDADVSEFDPNRIGQTDHGWYGEGHYLTASSELASGYSGYKNTKAIAGEEIHPGQNVMPVHARLENPYYWPEERRAATSRDEAKKITNELRKQGYDGVIAPNKYAEGPEAKFWEVVVFTPHQIKSATGNSGHYNMKSARIDRADGGSVDDEDEGLTAYHGSPHDFEQFDTSKIGTGEGAQAYGHGLYFAESEPVAQEYRDRLTDKTTNFRVGDIDMPKWILRSIETAEDKNAAIEKHRQDFSGRLAEAETERETSSQPWMVSGRISTAKDILAGLDQIQQGAPAPHTKGRMYEVRINAHPDHFLDWDAPLSEQSKYVKTALSDRAGLFEPGMPYDGQKLYRLFEDMHGDDSARASQELAKAGIKGIKYFDGSLRDKGKGSRNHVVFNHDHVEVKRKYARGGAIAET